MPVAARRVRAGRPVGACDEFRRGTAVCRGVTSSPAIEASGLVKTFGAVRAVDGVDLRVPRGAVYGVLGPNGAGKTTTIRMLATLLRPDAGRARVLGHDVVADADEVRVAREPHRASSPPSTTT